MLTTSQNIAEFWNVSTRPVQARGGFGLAIPTVEQRVKVIEKLGDVLPFSDRAYEEWRRLIVAYQVTGVAVHDAKLVATMITVGISHILTLNGDDFRRYSEIAAMTPEAVLALGSGTMPSP